MRRNALLPMLLVSACGGSPTPAANVHVETAKPAASVAPVPHAPLGIPHGAPFVATGNLPSLAAFAGARAEIERSLGLPQNSLSTNLADQGADPKRPMVFAFGPLTQEAAAVLHDLRGAPGDAVAAVRRVDAVRVLMSIRLLLPASDPAKLEKSMRDLVTKAGWTPEHDGFVLPHRVLAISSDASWVAMDVGLALGVDSSLSALAHVMSGPFDPPPPLEGAARFVWSPDELAGISFLMELSRTLGAISGESVSPEGKQRIFAEGYKEASGGFALAEQNGKPVFDRLDLTASGAPFEVKLRAQPGPGFTMPPEDAWSSGTSITIPGAKAELSESIAMLDAWHLPSDPLAIARDAGSLAIFIGLPQLLAAAPTALPRLSHAAGPSDEVARHFERIGESWGAKGDEIWFGVLPPKTTRDAAQCSLTTDVHCKGSAKLAVGGKATKQGHGFARLVEVDHRFVLLLAQDPALLAATPKTTTVGPLHFEGDPSDIGRQIGPALPLPARIVGDVSRADGAIVFRLTPK